ncbi:hypothetical protein [Verminephrobacter eiseniae]|uniref:hypothetical protein n=1 Tax=Verminephrobacter eiseniae TaxID=364317 RepID=UPI0022387A03|nr:hypothetical protein [Verminephrobacter eiseniae]
MTGQRSPAQTAWPALRVLAAQVLGRLQTTTTTIITALLLIPVLSLPCAALGATDPIGSGLAWLQSQILSDGQPSRTSALEAPTQARCETAKTLLRLLVSRHRSDVVGCAPPSERSARRIAQPIPSVLASDATPRCASMASADRQMIGDATLGSSPAVVTLTSTLPSDASHRLPGSIANAGLAERSVAGGHSADPGQTSPLRRPAGQFPRIDPPPCTRTTP